jgi:NAD(P)-dependent dehydrogenase (short-subunit alcohol dehydrogenase family)
MAKTGSDDQSMPGKVCLVTGATSGIGRVTAGALAARGATVVIAGRNPAKVQEAAAQITAATGNDSIQYLVADFADLQQVEEMAAAFKERYNRLDVLVNNAGSYFNRRHILDGVEMTFLVNHLAPFLLTNLLLEVLKASAPARIITVSSDAHKYDQMNFDDLSFKRGYFGMRAYARSKLANILFTYELARRLQGTSVTANVVHPGQVATNIWRTNFGILGPLLKWFIGLNALTPEEGADTVIYLASSPEVEGVSGKYFVKRRAVPSSPLSYDEEVASRLWEVSTALTPALSRSAGEGEIK